MDENRNGILEPNEISDRARGFLERIARDNRIDLSRPVPIDRLNEAFSRMRGRFGGRDRDRDDNDRGRSSSGDSSASEGNTGLVPGFGPDEEIPPIPGFGANAEVMVHVTDEDRRDADERFRRYDRNNDGLLDKDEMRRGRWSGDPFSYDRNKDGRLSRDELAVRYSERRRETEDESSSRSSSSRSSSGRSGSNRSGSDRSSGRSSSRSSDNSSDSRTEGMVKFMFDRYDQNHNGVIDKDEQGSMRGDPSGYDRNGDGKIEKDELGKAMQERFSSLGRGGGGGFGGGPGGGRGFFGRGGGDRDRGGRDGGDRNRGGRGGFFGRGGGDDDDRRRSFFSRRGGDDRRSGGDDDRGDSAGDSRWGDRNSFRFTNPLDRLPSDLDDWFATRDLNGDAQLSMAEYASRWSESVAGEFVKLDTNNDGVVTPQEALAAQSNGFEPGAGGSLADYRERTAPSETEVRDRATESAVSVASAQKESNADQTALEATSAAASASSPADVRLSPRYLDYAKKLIAKYDEDSDGELSRAEVAKMSRPPAEGADLDGNGKINATEYGVSMMSR